jgi:Ice-binding-like/Abnormal spindle-like microcephaly-assoc'd, ASPM-SPD-2-Hydin
LLALASPQMLSAAGPAPVNLGSTANFAILSGAAVTTTGGGTISGDVGASPITGAAIHLTCAQVSGTIYTVDAAGPLPCRVTDPILLTTAKGDLTIAYNDAAGRTPVPSGPFLNPNGGNIGGLNLAPGLYKFTATAYITGSDVTLTGGADDVWIFQCGQDLEVGVGRKVILAGGAQAKNVFWQVGTSATIGTSAVFNGTIIADQAITMMTSSTMNGRALAFSAGVTFNGTGMSVPPSVPSLGPIIAVQQPLGTNLVNGVGTNNFGFVVTNTSTNLTFTITNIGDADLTVSNITIDGVNSAMFTVITNPTPVLLGPGGRTNFTVRFTPVSTGLKIAELHIANTDPNSNPFNIALTGTGTGIGGIPIIAVQQPLGTNLVSGSTNDFGFVALSTNNSLTFTIKNSGNSNLTVSGITIDGVNLAMFTVTTNPTPATVIPGGSTNFTVRFTPGSTGLKTAALHIANNDTNNNPFNITITGTGGTPEIAVQQPLGVNLVSGVSSNYFGSVAVGTNTSRTFTITNSGNANLTGLSVTIDGTNSAMFIVTTNPTASVIPGGSTTFTVRFTPVDAGLKTAALHIANNATNNPFNITITGTGTGGVTSSTNVFVTGISPITLNPQTGLFEQTVQLYNNSLNTNAAVRLLILGLPDDVRVYNASGFTNGIPYLQYNFPLAPAASVDFLVEYYSADNDTNFQLAFVAQETTPVSVTATGARIKINRIVELNGRFLIEFSTTQSRSYAVQYSSDLTNWQTADPIIIAPANWVQWYDDGPPKTESKPTTIGYRFYRALELP